MQLSRAILVLGAEWACLTGGLVSGMAIERYARSEDVRIILVGVALPAFLAGSALRRVSLTERHEYNAGSVLFLLTSTVVNLMMVHDGTDGHVVDGVLCAAVAVVVFHVAATWSSRAAGTTTRSTGKQGWALPPLPIPTAQAGCRNLRAAPPRPAKGEAPPGPASFE